MRPPIPVSLCGEVVNIVVKTTMTIKLFSITVQGHTILSTYIHSYSVVCETLEEGERGGGGGGGEREMEERGRGRERERGERVRERERMINSKQHLYYATHLCGVEVENPEQSSSLKDDNLVSIMLSADVARALCHEVELLIQLHHGMVKVTEVLVPVALEHSVNE